MTGGMGMNVIQKNYKKTPIALITVPGFQKL
jgi:hypothetical protein